MWITGCGMEEGVKSRDLDLLERTVIIMAEHHLLMNPCEPRCPKALTRDPLYQDILYSHFDITVMVCFQSGSKVYRVIAYTSSAALRFGSNRSRITIRTARTLDC